MAKIKNINNIGKKLSITQGGRDLEQYLRKVVVESTSNVDDATAISLAHNNGRREMAMTIINAINTAEVIKEKK